MKSTNKLLSLVKLELVNQHKNSFMVSNVLGISVTAILLVSFGLDYELHSQRVATSAPVLFTICLMSFMSMIGVFCGPRLTRYFGGRSMLNDDLNELKHQVEFLYTKPISRRCVYVVTTWENYAVVLILIFSIMFLGLKAPDVRVWFANISEGEKVEVREKGVLEVLKQSFPIYSLQEDVHNNEEGVWFMAPKGMIGVCFLISWVILVGFSLCFVGHFLIETGIKYKGILSDQLILIIALLMWVVVSWICLFGAVLIEKGYRVVFGSSAFFSLGGWAFLSLCGLFVFALSNWLIFKHSRHI